MYLMPAEMRATLSHSWSKGLMYGHIHPKQEMILADLGGKKTPSNL